ncbi:hypothetical protein SUGI_0781410 [Cryptomeria japonica]|uniref:RING-H2 finger protein ATL64-like n=1 Tax=Cryptomeria japonica TaxID=3369 RepID=UPI002414A024|nr:RING-H2 finger protein ATL64-like [Cryptomeria japonica]GLJ38371.1 hypothetical protein SUGI_0781410 [Cryptomeria japonica]
MGNRSASHILDVTDRLSPLIVIALLLSLIILLKACVNYTCNRRSSTSTRGGVLREIPLSIRATGLDKESIDALPMFVYKSQSSKEEHECAVCLSQFEESEKVRMLTNCDHVFHTECIDMWFYSHTTCPLCRTNVQPKDSRKVESYGSSGEAIGTDNSLMEEPISSRIDSETNGMAAHGNLPRGERSSNAMQHENQASVFLLIGQNESIQETSGGRSFPQIAIDITPL